MSVKGFKELNFDKDCCPKGSICGVNPTFHLAKAFGSTFLFPLKPRREHFSLSSAGSGGRFFGGREAL